MLSPGTRKMPRNPDLEQRYESEVEERSKWTPIEDPDSSSVSETGSSDVTNAKARRLISFVGYARSNMQLVLGRQKKEATSSYFGQLPFVHVALVDNRKTGPLVVMRQIRKARGNLVTYQEREAKVDEIRNLTTRVSVG
jgi:hypothetical protein